MAIVVWWQGLDNKDGSQRELVKWSFISIFESQLLTLSAPSQYFIGFIINIINHS